MSYQTGQVNVGTTPTLIAMTGYPPDNDGILVTASAACFVGGPDVSTSTGYPIPASTAVLIPTSGSHSGSTEGGLYGVVASGTATVSFIVPG
ncbi:hypothetical protein [Candidatus Mycobacterium methanotrophicum]|uniref:Uncharacterized protein n=1 Tax=Candidatus Mycobacterium methanotrophicum TaxID=2943498 RepID=A0ABY4QK29_9MYCO|nr:hypothetical protein [Candidatus Mycobacterium methanotrophicum]UQX11323.1 hypothetical protein M5I08_01930 [Candidatus Mycobacterium methanotrophicum]